MACESLQNANDASDSSAQASAERNVFSGSHLVVRVCFVRSGTAAARLMRGLKQMMARRRVPLRGWRGWNSVLRLAGVSPGPASLDGLGAYVKRLNTHTIDPAIPPPGMCPTHLPRNACTRMQAALLVWLLLFQSAGSVVVVHGLSCPVACRILIPRPGIKPMCPALQSGFLTTGPPGKSPKTYF